MYTSFDSFQTAPGKAQFAPGHDRAVDCGHGLDKREIYNELQDLNFHFHSVAGDAGAAMSQLAGVHLAELEQSIGAQLDKPPYATAPGERSAALLALFKQELDYACGRSPQFRNYVQHWPLSVSAAETVADLPYLPVSMFKCDPPLSLVPTSEIKRTLASSSTSSQVPSRVVLDAATARRMTKGVITIIRDFIGPARTPYLVIDIEENLKPQAELGARGAAIQSLGSFATETVCCLRRDENGDSTLDIEKLLFCAEKWKSSEVLVYGFTYVIWTQLVQPLERRGITLGMPNIHVLHSGGWKRLEQQEVTKDAFMRGVAAAFGCSADRVVDYYGMVENVGVVYPDCEHGHKHVPAFAEVIIRDPLTLAPVEPKQQGLVHQQGQCLSGIRMFDSHGGTFADSSDGRDLGFDLAHADSHAANLDELVGAAFDPQIAVFVAAGKVTGLEPAAVELPSGGFGIVQITRAHRRPSHLDFAGLPERRLMSFLIGDANLEIVQRRTRAAKFLAQASCRQTGNPRRGFGLAVHHQEFSGRHDFTHLPDIFRSKRASSLQKTAQAGQGD